MSRLVAICIPTAGLVPMGFAHSLSRLTSLFTSRKINYAVNICESTNWISNRERLVQSSIDAGATHILFLDDDMIFHPEVGITLLSRNTDIVLSNYLVKTEPADRFTSWSESHENIVTTAQSEGLEKAAFGGFGVSLITARVFKSLESPFFAPRFIKEVQDHSTEDMPFFQRARAAGFDVWIDHDVSKHVGHVGRKVWYLNEYLSPLQVGAIDAVRS